MVQDQCLPTCADHGNDTQKLVPAAAALHLCCHTSASAAGTNMILLALGISLLAAVALLAVLLSAQPVVPAQLSAWPTLGFLYLQLLRAAVKGKKPPTELKGKPIKVCASLGCSWRQLLAGRQCDGAAVNRSWLYDSVLVQLSAAVGCTTVCCCRCQQQQAESVIMQCCSGCSSWQYDSVGCGFRDGGWTAQQHSTRQPSDQHWACHPAASPS
jgi:hypothetical protein